MADQIEALRNEIIQERRRLDGMEHKLDLMEKGQAKIMEVMQGDSAWKRKGMVEQLQEFAAFMEMMKGLDVKEFKEFMMEFRDVKKTILRASAFIVGTAAFVAALIKFFDNIKQYFH